MNLPKTVKKMKFKLSKYFISFKSFATYAFLFYFQAIFNEDLRDLRTPGIWNKWKPLDIIITLSPFQGSQGLREIHAQVDLRIICSENYPDVYVLKFSHRTQTFLFHYLTYFHLFVYHCCNHIVIFLFHQK